MGKRSRVALLSVVALALACRRPAAGPEVVRLIDAFDAKSVAGTSTTSPASGAAIPRTEWRFDGAPPLPKPAAPAVPAAPAAAATRGWQAGPGVGGLAIRDGLLVGRTTTEFPVIHLERTSGLDNP